MINQDEWFLPERIKTPVLPKDWKPDDSIAKIKRLTSIVKPKVEDIVVEFWIAHEKIVNKEIKGWTWTRFCREAGYSHVTPYNWFNKYGISYTQISKGGRRLIKNFISDNPLKKQTKPETKFKLEETAKIIKEEPVSDDDLKKVGDALASKIKKGEAAPRVVRFQSLF